MSADRKLDELLQPPQHEERCSAFCEAINTKHAGEFSGFILSASNPAQNIQKAISRNMQVARSEVEKNFLTRAEIAFQEESLSTSFASAFIVNVDPKMFGYPISEDLLEQMEKRLGEIALKNRGKLYSKTQPGEVKGGAYFIYSFD